MTKPGAAPAVHSLAERYAAVRAASERLCEPLETEDYVVQSMPDVSPTRWHLAHVTWFFETFALKPHLSGYEPFDAAFEYLFNSYYNTVGEQYPRPRRGLVTRPTVQEVFAYRAHVDEHMTRLLDGEAELSQRQHEVIETGLHHEQQHQELLLMDVQHVFSCNPLYPAYKAPEPKKTSQGGASLEWIAFDGGTYEIGHDGSGFGYDNERPRHRELLRPFALGSRLTTNREYLAFVEDGGYRRPELWLADGWATVQQEDWQAPLYWVAREEGRHEFSLRGLQALALDAPVAHVSYYEADAYARWAGARLAGEAEWEVAAAGVEPEGNFVERGELRPRPAAKAGGLQQMFGDVWEWTASPYGPYPGYRPPEGALGEYNGKFMCSQYVLRGGACVTPRSHIRATYRNFFYPHMRWQFAGIRLAKDA